MPSPKSYLPWLQAGLEPVVIGGGHNNAFGLLRALSTFHHAGVAAVNLDPHCDFRPLEGRHSGNSFSYAASQGYLNRYHILGLHEQKNSETSLQQLGDIRRQLAQLSGYLGTPAPALGAGTE